MRNICGIRRMNGLRNSLIRERCECEMNVLKRVERKVLKLFGHIQRMGKKDWVRE